MLKGIAADYTVSVREGRGPVPSIADCPGRACQPPPWHPQQHPGLSLHVAQPPSFLLRSRRRLETMNLVDDSRGNAVDQVQSTFAGQRQRPERRVRGPPRERPQVTRQHDKKTADAEVALEGDHLVRQVSRKKERLTGFDDEPPRAGHREKPRDAEPRVLAVHRAPLDVFQPASDALEGVPHQPEFFTGEAVIAAVGIIGVRIAERASGAHDHGQNFFAPDRVRRAREQIELAQSGAIDTRHHSGVANMQVGDADARAIARPAIE